MPIVTNKDGTMSLVEEQAQEQALPAPTQNIDWDAIPVQQTTKQEQPTPTVDWDTISEDDGSNVGVDWSTIREEPSLMSADVTAGIINGVTNWNFTSNVGKIMESWMPSYMPSRLRLADEEGNFDFGYNTGAEYLGITNEEWDSMEPEQLRVLLTDKSTSDVAKLFDADPESTAFMVSSIAGSIVDPTSFIGKGATALGTAGRFGAVGAADIGALEMAHEGQPSALGIGLGAGLGGALGAVSKISTKGGRVRATAKQQLDDFATVFNANKSKYDNAVVAYQKTLDDLGTTGQYISDLSRKSIYTPNPVRKRRSPKTSVIGKKYNKVMDEVDRYIEPISERIKKIAGKGTFKFLSQAEREMKTQNHVLVTMADQFLTMLDAKTINPFGKGGLRQSNPAAHRKIWSGLLNDANPLEMDAMVKHYMGNAGVKAYRNFQEAMNVTYDMAVKARGVKSVGPKLSTYAHRALKNYKDIDGILVKKGSVHKSRLDALIKKRGITSDKEITKLYSDYFNGYLDAKKTTKVPSSVRKRKVKYIEDEYLDLYHTPSMATHTHIREVVEDASVKKLFGKDIVAKRGDDLTGSIADYVYKLQKQGKVAADDIEELKHLLNLRFDKGVIASPEWVQSIKNAGYIMTLGNPISAITQFGDMYLSVAKNGFGNTLAGIASVIGRRGLSPTEFGLMESMLEEMVSTSASKKWLTKALKAGGFASVDKWGKKTVMNASLRKMTRLAKSKKGLTKLHREWGEAMGNDFPQFAKDLQAGKMSDDVKTAVFMDLANIQPITLLEMPEMYLSHPAGRLFYMLKTFQLKYINLLRQATVDNFTAGNNIEAIKNGVLLMSMMAAGGITTDTMKNGILNKNEHMDDMITDNILKSTGILDRYTSGKISTSKAPLTQIISRNFAPPVSIFDPFAVGIIQAGRGEFNNDDARNMAQRIPIVGPILSNYAMGGRQYWNYKRYQEGVNQGDYYSEPYRDPY